MNCDLSLAGCMPIRVSMLKTYAGHRDAKTTALHLDGMGE
jgi:hypothetical protein